MSPVAADQVVVMETRSVEPDVPALMLMFFDVKEASDESEAGRKDAFLQVFLWSWFQSCSCRLQGQQTRPH